MTVGEDYPKQQEKARAIIGAMKDAAANLPDGIAKFYLRGVEQIEAALKHADKAAMNHHGLPTFYIAYENLKSVNDEYVGFLE